MPRLVRMDALIERAKLRADKDEDDHITDAAWRSFISEAWGTHVYSVVAGTGGRYFEYKLTRTTDGTAYVDEPSDCMSLVGVDYVDSSGRHWPLDPLEQQEEAFYAGAAAGARAFYYTLVDDRLYLYPTPPTDQSYELQYIPQPQDLAEFDDDQCVDVVTTDGEAAVTWGAGGIALVRAKQDASFHIGKQEQHSKALQLWACERLMNEPHRVVVKVNEIDRRQMDPGDWRWR